MKSIILICILLNIFIHKNFVQADLESVEDGVIEDSHDTFKNKRLVTKFGETSKNLIETMTNDPETMERICKVVDIKRALNLPVDSELSVFCGDDISSRMLFNPQTRWGKRGYFVPQSRWGKRSNFNPQTRWGKRSAFNPQTRWGRNEAVEQDD
jgi:hypothetical protein